MAEQSESPKRKDSPGILSALQKPAWLVATLAALFVLGGIAGFYIAPRVVENATAARISVDQEGFHIEIERGEVDFTVILDSLALDTRRWGMVEDYLERNYSLYTAQSIDYQAVLDSMAANEPDWASLTEYLEDRGLFDLRRPSFVHRLAELLPDSVVNEDPVARSQRLNALLRKPEFEGISTLRTRAKAGDPPFQDEGELIPVGNPGEAVQPRPHLVHVKPGSPLDGRVIELTSTGMQQPSRNSLRLLAIPCLDAREVVDAHLNNRQVEHLELHFAGDTEEVLIRAYPARRTDGRGAIVRDLGADSVLASKTVDALEDRSCGP